MARLTALAFAVVAVLGAFTGRLVQTLAEGRTETDYLDGRRHGDQRGWYPDGSAREYRTYRAGRREGLHIGWWPDGQLAQESHYEAGQEAGRQRMWTHEGDLRANYVVADGRRYGLLGAKPCSTP